jgi:hypothetical protein
MQSKIDLFLSQMAEIDRLRAMRIERFCAMMVPWQFNTHFIVSTDIPAEARVEIGSRRFSSLAANIAYLQMVAPDITRLDKSIDISLEGGFDLDMEPVNISNFKTSPGRFLRIHAIRKPEWDIGTYKYILPNYKKAKLYNIQNQGGEG